MSRNKREGHYAGYCGAHRRYKWSEPKYNRYKNHWFIYSWKVGKIVTKIVDNPAEL